MYLKRLVLQNIKSFEVLDFDFAADGVPFEGWTVITGDNGTGKTAILKSIALALLGPDVARIVSPDLRGWVSNGSPRGSISLEIRPDHDVDRTRRGGHPVAHTFWAELEISEEGSKVPTIEPTDIFRNKKLSAINGPWAESTPGWLGIGYGPFRRMYGSSPDAQRLMVIPGRTPKFATLFKEDATLGEGEEWVKTLHFKRLEQRESEERALDALLKFLGSDFLRNGLAIETVDSEGIWLRDWKGRRLHFGDMSEGYRAALAMLIDIFRHMVDAYGVNDLVSQAPDGTHVITKPAVILIDEIDAHLHPEWQRQIGFWLKKHFPMVQFIVTTHSPLICQAADRGKIFVLPAPSEGQEDAPQPFRLSDVEYWQIVTGKPDEILLSSAFGMAHTRSPRAVRARDRHARLFSKQLSFQLSETEIREMEQLNLFVEGVQGA